MYWSGGVVGVAAWSSNPENWGNGFPVDAVYDCFEARIGTFTTVSHTVQLQVNQPTYGTVVFSPELLDDPNHDPNSVDELRRFTNGTEIAVTATPVSGKTFVGWTIYSDPNKYPDANYAVTDANSVIYLVMDKDYLLDVEFKCGSGLPPFIAAALLALGVGVVIRRLW
jgi:hypothetical protein